MSAEEFDSQILALALAQENEIRQRLAEMEADPALRIPFTEADVERMFREFAEDRIHKTSPLDR